MIDFSTLQDLSIPEGVVTQIEDDSGRVIWKLITGEPIILQVEKITSDTHVGEATYQGEQFILLDIYPKTNGTVRVTYGGLSKTIKDTSGAESPNAQQVFFGKFNNISDGVATPASGTLTITGEYTGFGCGVFNINKTDSKICTCITAINAYGTITQFPAFAFGSLTTACDKITDIVIPASVVFISSTAFLGCPNLTSVTFENTNGWYCTTVDFEGREEYNTMGDGTLYPLNDPVRNVTLLKTTLDADWFRK